MQVNEMTARASRRKRRRRVGCGIGSGRGKTCGRGHKGCQSRSGGGVRRLTEGGQMVLFRRLPKRGFSNARFRKSYVAINVGQLDERFESGATVMGATLAEAGLLRKATQPFKILGDGSLTKKLTVEAPKFSESARQKIAAVGGEAKPARN